MDDGRPAAVGAGDEVGRFVLGRRGGGIGLGRAADKAGPLGPAAGLAKHGACPKVLASMSAAIHRGVIARSSDSRTFRNAFGGARKKVFL
jgi:hypothetical protein